MSLFGNFLLWTENKTVFFLFSFVNGCLLPDLLMRQCQTATIVFLHFITSAKQDSLKKCNFSSNFSSKSSNNLIFNVKTFILILYLQTICLRMFGILSFSIQKWHYHCRWFFFWIAVIILLDLFNFCKIIIIFLFLKRMTHFRFGIFPKSHHTNFPLQVTKGLAIF